MISKKKNKIVGQQIFNNPIFMFVTAIFAILVILSLKESNQKANLSKDNLAKNQANIAQLKNKAELKKEFFSETKSDLYKEKIQRNELLQQKDNEITLQIATKDLDPSEKAENVNLNQKDISLANWQAWMDLLKE